MGATGAAGFRWRHGVARGHVPRTQPISARHAPYTKASNTHDATAPSRDDADRPAERDETDEEWWTEAARSWNRSPATACPSCGCRGSAGMTTGATTSRWGLSWDPSARSGRSRPTGKASWNSNGVCLSPTSGGPPSVTCGSVIGTWPCAPRPPRRLAAQSCGSPLVARACTRSSVGRSSSRSAASGARCSLRCTSNSSRACAGSRGPHGRGVVPRVRPAVPHPRRPPLELLHRSRSVPLVAARTPQAPGSPAHSHTP